MDVIIGVAIYFIIIVFGVVTIVNELSTMLDNKNKKHKSEKFKVEMILAIEHSQPSWEELLDMAELSKVDVKSAYNVSREILKEILTGEKSELEKYKSLVEGYIAKHKKSEPFEDMPSQTRIHLERLASVISDKDFSLEPLTMQIRELVTVYESENKKQKNYTRWGFIVGIIAVCFAVYTYINPITA